MAVHVARGADSAGHRHPDPGRVGHRILLRILFVVAGVADMTIGTCDPGVGTIQGVLRQPVRTRGQTGVISLMTHQTRLAHARNFLGVLGGEILLEEAEAESANEQDEEALRDESTV
jgi:hypothetical protein